MGIIAPPLTRAQMEAYVAERGLNEPPAERPAQVEAVGVAKLELGYLEKVTTILEALRAALHKTGVTK